jgi:hypothetical protein
VDPEFNHRLPCEWNLMWPVQGWLRGVFAKPDCQNGDSRDSPQRCRLLCET